MTIDYAARARALVGTPFRPQGRSPTGFDCVGVVLATFGMPPEAVRRNYRLRGDHLQEISEALALNFRRLPKSQAHAGDLLLLETGARQLHLAVRTEDGFVHAHAGIGRVVETPGMPTWPTLRAYRKRRG